MTRRWALGAAAILMASAFAVAVSPDIPLRNWSAPKFWTPPAPSGTRHLMTDLGGPVPLVAITPCRIADTRGSGFSGQAGPPALAANAGRSFQVTGVVATIPTQCGIPAGARAASFNFTVVNMTSNGNLIAWPPGSGQPNTSVLNWNASSVVAGNSGVVPLGGGGAVRVLANAPAGASVDLVIDVNGYFTGQLDDNENLDLSGSFSNDGVIVGRNSAPFGNGVEGFALLSGYGVYGSSAGPNSTGAGVYGTADLGAGVSANSNADAIVSVGGHDGARLLGIHNGVTGMDGTGLPQGTDSLDSGGVVGGSINHTGVIGVSRINAGGVAASFHKLNDVSPYGDVTHVTLCPTATTAANFFGNVNINAAAGAPGTGDLSVVGTLSKGGGSFKIDHPLDPENKYLYHSFVESPDMMNVYNGNVVLDGHGEATVELPDYFEALNSDYRYVLTSIGRFSPVYVADEIANNRFRIAGGRPGAKVSWQVTGIRQDAFAKAHRIQVEVEKEPELKGTYLHPAELGKPLERASGPVQERAEREREVRGVAGSKSSNR